MVEVQKDTLLSGRDTIFVNLYDSVETTYFFKLCNKGTGSSFKVASFYSCYSFGDLGFCPGQGQYLTVKAGAIGLSGGTASYTWSPGGAHTYSIGITPTGTVPITYTVNYAYSMPAFSATIIATVYPLPAGDCNNCELVKNGSFELNQHPTGVISDISYPTYTVNNCYNFPFSGVGSDPKGWVGPVYCQSPDYFKSIYPGGAPGSAGVPNNVLSIGSPAHSGGSYAGFVTSDDNTGFQLNYREYIQQKLKCGLITGQLYNLSFYTSQANFNVANPQATNNIGAYLSTSSFSPTPTGPVLNYTPQINANSVIANHGSWTQVAGTMVGNGEQYITVGNFFDDNHTQIQNSSTLNGAYYFVDDISVSPVPLILSASSCQAGTVTISAFGAPSSTLTTWQGPSSYTATGSSISVPSPTIATTYTCSVNLAGNSCPSCPDSPPFNFSQDGTTYPCIACSTAIATITIQPVPCSGTQPGSYTFTSGSYTYNPTQGYIAQTLYINGGNYTINSAEVRITATASIVVGAGATLTISNSWLHVCTPCNAQMWPGITVQNGGVLIINNSIIEDATNAVYTASSASTTPIPSYTITNSIFNNNATGIFIDTHQGNLSGNTVYNTVFTCRSLGSHLTSNISSTKSDIAAATPLLASALNPIDKTIAGVRSANGIYINTINTANPITIGNKTQSSNIFDNLNYGIYSLKTSLTIKNNVFQNLTGNNSDFMGIGIYSNSANGHTTTATTIIVGNSNITVDNTETNYFNNCLRGIETIQSRVLFINNNIFNNETTATTFTTSGTYITGEYGVYTSGFALRSNTITPEQMLYANNTCTNYATGHYIDFSELYNTSTSNQAILMKQNTITATNLQYCSYGIYTSQSNAGFNTGVPQTAFEITANTITNVNINCIYSTAMNSSSATSGFFIIDQNTELAVKANSTYTVVQTPRVAAVRVDGSYYTRVSDNTNIHCTLVPLYAAAPKGHAGIYVTSSPHTQVTCNTIYGIGECLVWEGTSTTYNNNISRNTLSSGYYGFVLRNTGICGDQGATGFPHDNVWTTGSYFSAHTLSDNSDPSTGTTSKLYCRAATCTVSTTYMPCTNSGIHSPYVAYASGTTLISTSGSSGLNCSSSGGGGGGRLAAHNNTYGADSSAVIDSTHYKNIQSTIADNSYTYPAYDAETRWALQHYVSSTMPNIPAAQGYQNAKTLALADAAFASGDYGTALSLTNSFAASNVIESNWQTVNSAQIKLQTDTLSPTDISNLQAVAVQCYLTGGSVVFRARAMLNTYYGTIIEYPNACPTNNGDGDRKQITASIATTVNNQSINLYPNPNNGSMTLEYNISKDAYLEITNINGNLVGRYALLSTTNKLDVRNDNLSNGVYLYRVINDAVLKTGKIVIMK